MGKNIRDRVVKEGDKLFIHHDGLKFEVDLEEIKPGDDYLAERNTGPVLLKCRKVRLENNLLGGFICPEGIGYAFDIPECIRVVEICETD